jgi:hypothetical protein
MKCPICQEEILESNFEVGYCDIYVQLAPGFRASHYEYFVRSNQKNQMYYTDVVRVPPFIILRQENGYLEVKQWIFNLGIPSLIVIMQKDNSAPTDLLCYYHRFKNLRVFS